MNVLGFKLFDFSFYGNTNFLFIHFFFLYSLCSREISIILLTLLISIDNVRYIFILSLRKIYLYFLMFIWDYPSLNKL